MAWSYIWTVPSEVRLDVNQGYQISFAVDPDQHKVATSPVFFLRPDASKASSSPVLGSSAQTQTPSASISSTQDTTLPTNTFPASSTTSAVSPSGSTPIGISPATHHSGLSKGVSAGIAIGTVALLALLILGGWKLHRFFHKRSKGKQTAESLDIPWSGLKPTNITGDEREQSPESPRDTSDGRTIIHLGLQHPEVSQLGGVELQAMSTKTAAVLRLEEERGPSRVRSGREDLKPAGVARYPPPYCSLSPSSLPPYSTQPPRPPRSNEAFGSPEPSV